MNVFLSDLESHSAIWQNICDGLVSFIVKFNNLSLVNADPDGPTVLGCGSEAARLL
jgi:hypothetical protein